MSRDYIASIAEELERRWGWESYRFQPFGELYIQRATLRKRG